jgi:hypothetical protein
MPSMHSPNKNYLMAGVFPHSPFPRMLASLVPGPKQLLLQWLCPMSHLSPTLATRPEHPCASTILVPALVQEWPNGTAVTHCCAAVVLDRISATVTYVMWCEKTFGMLVCSKDYTFSILLTLL